MAEISQKFGSGGANLVPGGSAGSPSLADALRDIADDLSALKLAPVATPDAGDAYGANEKDLLNELKVKLNAIAAVTLKTTKAP